jgi:predicted P-loop ATPase
MPLTPEQEKLVREVEATHGNYQQDIEHASAGLGRRPILPGPMMPVSHDVKREVSRAAAKIAQNTLRERVIEIKGGVPRGCISNAMDALRLDPEWNGVLAYDEFTHRTIIKKSTPWGKPAKSAWENSDDTYCLEWLERHGIFLGSSAKAGEAVEGVAKENRVHPVQEWIHSLVWDGTERLPFWLRDYFGVQDSPFVRAVSSRWLISAIARIFSPGCQADHVLLLEGSQGVGKSSGLRALFSDEWFTDSIPTLGTKDAMLQLRGKWCVELAELSAMKRADIEVIKNTLSMRIDRLRDPYGRRAMDFPRQNVFAATTNSSSSLNDETGARRFWPIHCGRVRVQELAAVRGLLFAEAYSAYRQARAWHLDSDELNALAKEETAARFISGQWDDLIAQFLENPKPRTVTEDEFLSCRGQVSITDVLIHCIGKEPKTWNQADQNTVARFLKFRGYERKRIKVGSRREWLYVTRAD